MYSERADDSAAPVRSPGQITAMQRARHGLARTLCHRSGSTGAVTCRAPYLPNTFARFCPPRLRC